MGGERERGRGLGDKITPKQSPVVDNAFIINCLYTPAEVTELFMKEIGMIADETNGAMGNEDPEVESDHSDDSFTEEEAKFNQMMLDQRKMSVIDPNCLPDRPQAVTFADVTSAAFKIKNGVANTPCARSHLSDLTGMEIFLKKDFMQTTGSFKERGACYALLMLTDEQRKKGVISASLGNHAQALCYHGQRLGVPVTVVMPVVAPIMKIQACRRFGATVIVEGNDMKEAKRMAMLKGRELGLTYINGYDHPHIIAGQGTLGLEIVEQVQDFDAVVVPVGGGGLIAGVALAVKSLHPNVKVIGVESDRCASFSNALSCGKPTPVPIKSTLADGLAVPLVGYNAFHTASPLIDKMVVVKEEWIAIAILRLVEMEKCVVEGAGAIGLAAILAGHLSEFKNKRVVLILCGGNIDTTILGRCLDRGLTADGRLIKFSVVASDRPGGIAELCRLLADMEVSIKDILHERAWITNDIFSVKVKVVCESRDLEHSRQLMKVLSERYTSVNFGDFMDSQGFRHRLTPSPNTLDVNLLEQGVTHNGI